MKPSQCLRWLSKSLTTSFFSVQNITLKWLDKALSIALAGRSGGTRSTMSLAQLARLESYHGMLLIAMLWQKTMFENLHERLGTTSESTGRVSRVWPQSQLLKHAKHTGVPSTHITSLCRSKYKGLNNMNILCCAAVICPNMCWSLLHVMSDSKTNSSNNFCIWKRFWFLKKIKFAPLFSRYERSFFCGTKKIKKFNFDFQIFSRSLPRAVWAAISNPVSEFKSDLDSKSYDVVPTCNS